MNFQYHIVFILLHQVLSVLLFLSKFDEIMRISELPMVTSYSCSYISHHGDIIFFFACSDDYDNVVLPFGCCLLMQTSPHRLASSKPCTSNVLKVAYSV